MIPAAAEVRSVAFWLGMDRGVGAGGDRAWVGFGRHAGFEVAVFFCCFCDPCGCGTVD